MADHIKIGDIAPWEQTVQTVAGNTAFQYHFPIFKDADLEVYVDDKLKALTADYTVSGAGNDDGGTITMTVAPEVGATITRRRRLAIERTSDFQDSGEFRAKVINDELDYQTAVIQQVADDIVRSIVAAPTDPVGNLMLPTIADRALRFLAFDAGGNPVGATALGDAIVSAAMAAVVAAATLAAARAALGVAIGSDVQGYDAATARTNAVQTWTKAQKQAEVALGSLDAMAGDTLTLADLSDADSNSNQYTLALDVDGTIDATGLAYPTVIIATNSGARSLTVQNAYLDPNCPAFDGADAKVNILTFIPEAGAVDYSITQRGS